MIDNNKRLCGRVHVSEKQVGFMQGRSTTDACFAQRQLMQRCVERKKLHSVFNDMEKGYDRVRKEEIWNCLR